MEVCAVSVVVGKDGKEHILSACDSTFALIGDSQEEDRRQIADLVTSRMTVSLSKCPALSIDLQISLYLSLRTFADPTCCPASCHHARLSPRAPRVPLMIWHRHRRCLPDPGQHPWADHHPYRNALRPQWAPLDVLVAAAASRNCPRSRSRRRRCPALWVAAAQQCVAIRRPRSRRTSRRCPGPDSVLRNNLRARWLRMRRTP